MISFSIITVSLNSEKTIRQTIESIVSQNYCNMQYIIIDGASTDRTLDIVNEYADNIDIIISEKDKGISDAFNKGIALATGDVIGIINSDDMLAPNSLSVISDSIEQDTDVLYGNMESFGEDIVSQVNKPGKLSGMKKCMTLFHPATFIRKEAYKKYGMYSLDCKYCMDRELLLRMLSGNAKFQYIDKTLACYRTGGVSDSGYLKGTLPEGARISKQYGRNPFWVNVDSLERKTKYKLSRFLRTNRVGKRIRLLYHQIKK